MLKKKVGKDDENTVGNNIKDGEKGKKKKYKKRKKLMLALVILLVISGGAYGILVYNDILWIERPSDSKYPVKGVDVSHYQGKIDWKVLANQGISFAFIKATEGSSSVDECYEYNVMQANRTGLKVGAYHFFSFDSSGTTQAENIIQTVKPETLDLPIVIDLEFYGGKASNPPSKESVEKELDILLNRLEIYYGTKPIIYTTLRAYNLYIKDTYEDYPLWMRNTYYRPFFMSKREWQFWQFTDSEVLDGYKGDEPCIDMNVFNGTQEEFEQLYVKNEK